MNPHRTPHLIALALLLALTAACGDSPEQRRGAAGERCFIDDDCRAGLICVGSLGTLGGLGGLTSGQVNTSGGLGGLGGLGTLGGPRCAEPGLGGLGGVPASGGAGSDDSEGREEGVTDPGGPIEDDPAPDVGGIDQELRTYRIDTLNLSAPPLSEEIGFLQETIDAGDTNILLQIAAATFEGREEPAIVTLGPGEAAGGAWAFTEGLARSAEGRVDDAGVDAYQVTTAEPLEVWYLVVRFGGEFVIPIREVNLPIVGVLSGRVQKAELTGVLHRDDAKEIFLPGLGATLADLLADTPAELDTDGDGAPDSWIVRGEFSGGEVEVAP